MNGPTGARFIQSLAASRPQPTAIHMDCSPQPKPTTDGLACSGCPLGDCPASQDESPLSGWRLVLASMGPFLGPPVLAIAGAAWFGGSQGAQLLGALAGLGIGIAAAIVAARRWGRAATGEPIKTSE